MEIMVNEMVKQGVITREQGDQMLKNMKETKAKEQEKTPEVQAKAAAEQGKIGVKSYEPGAGRTLTTSLVDLTIGGFSRSPQEFIAAASRDCDVELENWNLGGGGYPTTQFTELLPRRASF